MIKPFATLETGDDGKPLDFLLVLHELGEILKILHKELSLSWLPQKERHLSINDLIAF